MHNIFTPKLNILHIDDSAFVLSSIKRLLSKFTSYYYQATNGVIGLELYHKYSDILDMVIIDIHLPDTDGIKIAKEIRDKNPSVVLIILTSDMTHATIEEFQNILIDVFITKEKFVDEYSLVLSTVEQRIKIHRLLTQSNNIHLNFHQIDQLTIQARLDLNGNYIHVNKSFQHLTGYTAHELIGSNARILRHPERDPKAIPELWDTLLRGEKYEGTFADLTKNGKTIYLQKNISPVRDKNGTIYEYFLLAFDVTDSYKLQKITKSKNTILKSIINLLPNIVCISDGTYLFAVNENFCTFFQVDSLEVFLESHKCVCELFVDDEKDLIVNSHEKNWIQQIIDNQDRGTASKVKFKQDGLVYYFKVLVQVYENDLRKILFVDITKDIVSKQINTAIKFFVEPEESIKAKTLVLLLDLEGNVLEEDGSLEYFTGYKVSDLLGNNSACLCAIGKLDGSLLEANEKGYAEGEQWLMKKDGSSYYAEISLTKVVGHYDYDDYFVFVSRDLTATLNMVEKLRELSHRYTVIFEQTVDGYVLIDKDGLILESNYQYQTLMGYSQYDLLNMNINDFSLESKFKHILHLEESSLMTLGWERFELAQRAKSGEVIFFEITITFLKENTFIVNFRDLSELKKQEQMIAYSARAAALGEMVGNIAHQWRQPLATVSAIMMEIEFLQELGELTDEMQADAFGRINSSIRYLSNTIDDFRSFFRGDKTVAMIPLHETINLAISIVEHSFEKLGIAIIIQDESMDVQVAINPNEFSQVLINILNNARDIFSERGTKSPVVKMILGCEEKSSFIKIQDNAGGIASDIITKIFDPYFTTKHQSQGTGLGLHMSSTIIEKHFNGTLSVSNVEDGAEFLIMLPIMLPIHEL